MKLLKLRKECFNKYYVKVIASNMDREDNIGRELNYCIYWK